MAIVMIPVTVEGLDLTVTAIPEDTGEITSGIELVAVEREPGTYQFDNTELTGTHKLIVYRGDLAIGEWWAVLSLTDKVIAECSYVLATLQLKLNALRDAVLNRLGPPQTTSIAGDIQVIRRRQNRMVTVGDIDAAAITKLVRAIPQPGPVIMPTITVAAAPLRELQQMENIPLTGTSVAMINNSNVKGRVVGEAGQNLVVVKVNGKTRIISTDKLAGM